MRRKAGRCMLAAMTLIGFVGCASGLGTQTIDIPDNYAAAFEQGAEGGALKFYALADKVPTWGAVSQAGVFLCSEHRPDVIPQEARSGLGAFPSGTLLRLNTAEVKKTLGIESLLITVPAAVSGCTAAALEEIRKTPGMLLMVDSAESFEERSQLVEVLLK